MYKITNNSISFLRDYNGTSFCDIIKNHNETNETKIDEIEFGKDFNQDIFFLPRYITKITFDKYSKFNKKYVFIYRYKINWRYDIL